MESKLWYVYLKSRPDGSPFYVGKGSGNRHRSTSGRVQRYRDILAKYGEENIITSFLCYSTHESVVLAAERKFVLAFRASGIDLVNISDGGEVCVIPEGVFARRAATLRKTLSTPEARALKSAAMKKVYLRPGYKEAQKERIKEINARLDVRAKHAARVKADWCDPEKRARYTLRNREICNRLEVRAARSDAMRSIWANPEYRVQTGAKISASRKKRNEKLSVTPTVGDQDANKT